MTIIHLAPLLAVGQVIGASIGVVTAIWGEFAYIKAHRDGMINHAERAHLTMISHGLRFGLTLLLVSSLGLTLIAYEIRSKLQPALTPSFWILMILSLLVIFVAWALSRHKLSFAVGSATLFTAWWFLAYLTLGLLPALPFGSIVALFVVATAVFAVILHWARRFIWHSPR